MRSLDSGRVFVLFGPRCVAYGIFVPQPGLELRAAALGGQSLNLDCQGKSQQWQFVEFSGLVPSGVWDLSSLIG